MKKMKKLIAFALLGIMVAAALAGCGKSGGKAKDGNVTISQKDAPKMGTPENTLDLDAVYAKIDYTRDMFHASYVINQSGKGEEDFIKNQPQVDFGLLTPSGNQTALTAVPFEMYGGLENYSRDCADNILALYFLTEDGNLCPYSFVYTIDGNKLKLDYVEDVYVDPKTGYAEYTPTDISLEYEFAFKGATLTLSGYGASVKLYANLDAYCEVLRYQASGYNYGGDDRFEDIYWASVCWDKKYGDWEYCYFAQENERGWKWNAAIEEEGPFTVTWQDAETEEVRTHAFAYFLCDDGLILADNNGVYNYLEPYGGSLAYNLSESDQQTLANMSEEQVAEVMEKKADLFADLAAAFENAGLNVTVNEETGEILMDSAVLFGGDSAEVTAAGQDLLNKVMGVYTDVVFDAKYEGFVSEIEVGGHTAPLAGSTYESGLALSEERAENVKAYCLSDECEASQAHAAELSQMMTAVGYSCTMPITNAAGEVDLAASRRVVFKIVISLG